MSTRRRRPESFNTTRETPRRIPCAPDRNYSTRGEILDERVVRRARNFLRLRHTTYCPARDVGAPERRPEPSRLCAFVAVAEERLHRVGAEMKGIHSWVGSRNCGILQRCSLQLSGRRCQFKRRKQHVFQYTESMLRDRMARVVNRVVRAASPREPLMMTYLDQPWGNRCQALELPRESSGTFGAGSGWLLRLTTDQMRRERGG